MFARLVRVRSSRRLLVAAGVLAVFVALVAIGLLVVYPRVGAWYIREKTVPRLAARLGRAITVGRIEVGLGHATVHDVRVAGPRDGGGPLVRLDRVDIAFATLPSLVGSAQVEDIAIRGGAVMIFRDLDGRDNLEGLGGGKAPSGSGRSTGGAPIRWSGITLEVVDLADGIRGRAEELHGTRRHGVSTLVIDRAAAVTDDGPTFRVEAIELSRAAGTTEATVAGGELTVWTGLSLTGINGTIGLAPEPGRLAVSLAGGYGGVDGTLWTARGWVEPAAATGEIRLVADQFSLDRLRPILEHSVLVDYPKTTVDADIVLAREGPVGRLRGGFHVRDLTVAHAMIAEQPVRVESLSGDVEVTYDRSTRTYTLLRGDFGTRGLPFQLTGAATLRRGTTPPRLAARFVVPPVGCQQVLTALPAQLTGSEMTAFELTGKFTTDLHVAIDWANLQATELGGSVGINGCRARKVAPSVERLAGSFEHFVEVDRGEWLSFVIGPENPDFVPLVDVSPYLLQSLQTTEDGAFYKHHGFLPREFRTALIRNLEAGGFKYGASSISMQTVKNVLLYRQKTLARKFQELFLTWAVENFLEKDRILEIYVNAIEYGPGLYGIGPAAQEYFGKPARDITAKEAAFFSSILPNPKERYRQYCKGTLRRWTEDKIGRILDKMLERGRITQEEHDLAVAQPLVFVKDGTETEDECNRRVAKALKNARPTRPVLPP